MSAHAFRLMPAMPTGRWVHLTMVIEGGSTHTEWRALDGSDDSYRAAARRVHLSRQYRERRLRNRRRRA